MDYLPHHSAFENEEHEEGEKRIVPILIQTPQSDTKDLEDEEWRNGVFLE
jgi:hypothetical protein